MRRSSSSRPKGSATKERPVQLSFSYSRSKNRGDRARRQHYFMARQRLLCGGCPTTARCQPYLWLAVGLLPGLRPWGALSLARCRAPSGTSSLGSPISGSLSGSFRDFVPGEPYLWLALGLLPGLRPWGALSLARSRAPSGTSSLGSPISGSLSGSFRDFAPGEPFARCISGSLSGSFRDFVPGEPFARCISGSLSGSFRDFVPGEPFARCAMSAR